MKRLLIVSVILLFIQFIHYWLLYPVSNYDPNSAERTVMAWSTLIGLVGLVAYRLVTNDKQQRNTTKILWGVQWVWLVGVFWATWDFPWIFVQEPCYQCVTNTVVYIHPAIRYSFNLFLLFPLLRFCTEKVVLGKWVDRALWFIPFIVYSMYLLSLVFGSRPYAV